MVSLGDKKYQKGKIYFIGNYVDDDIYIGSTTQTLKRKFNKHKIQIDNDKTKHRKLYAKMIELGVECFYIEEIEKCPCNDVGRTTKERTTLYFRKKTSIEYTNTIENNGRMEKRQSRAFTGI